MYHHNNDIHPLVSDTGKYFCYINNRIDSVGVNMMMMMMTMMMTILAIREKSESDFLLARQKKVKLNQIFFVKMNSDLIPYLVELQMTTMMYKLLRRR